MRQRILLTGGGTGIGRALAIELTKRGHRVLTCGRRADVIADLKAGHPEIHVFTCDITSEQDRQRLLQEATRLFGGLDVLINNAGVQEAQTYGSGVLDHAKLEAEMRINLIAPMQLTDLAIPLLRNGESPAILNMVSLLAVIPKPSAPGYCASKAGLLGFTRSLRTQLCSGPIRVVEVFPPLVDTPMMVGRGRSKMSSERCAALIADGFETKRESITVGVATTLLLLSRLFPSLAQRTLNQMIRPAATAAVSTITH
jgi:uncharacterized oxidoreductase